MKKKLGFIIGTPFCGSTLLGNFLNSIPGFSYLGEVDRLTVFKRWPVDQEYYTNECMICSTKEKCDCSLWSNDLLRKLSGLNIVSGYKEILKLVDSSVVIDGSKTADWIRDLYDQGLDIPCFAILCTRLPFSFVTSNAGAVGLPAYRSAEMWRDVYFHAIRVLNGRGIPYVVLRYEDFAANPQRSLLPLLKLLKISGGVGEDYYSHDIHPIGGNVSAYVKYNKFCRDGWLGKFPGDREKLEYWESRPTKLSVDFKWADALSDSEIADVLHTPSLADIASLLGYDLSMYIKFRAVR